MPLRVSHFWDPPNPLADKRVANSALARATPPRLAPRRSHLVPSVGQPAPRRTILFPCRRALPGDRCHRGFHPAEAFPRERTGHHRCPGLPRDGTSCFHHADRRPATEPSWLEAELSADRNDQGDRAATGQTNQHAGPKRRFGPPYGYATSSRSTAESTCEFAFHFGSACSCGRATRRNSRTVHLPYRTRERRQADNCPKSQSSDEEYQADQCGPRLFATRHRLLARASDVENGNNRSLDQSEQSKCRCPGLILREARYQGSDAYPRRNADNHSQSGTRN